MCRPMSYGAEEKKTVGKIALLHGLVPEPGLEPGWIAPTVFETVASTDSAIRADGADAAYGPMWLRRDATSVVGAKLRNYFGFHKRG